MIYHFYSQKKRRDGSKGAVAAGKGLLSLESKNECFGSVSVVSATYGDFENVVKSLKIASKHQIELCDPTQKHIQNYTWSSRNLGLYSGV